MKVVMQGSVVEGASRGISPGCRHWRSSILGSLLSSTMIVRWLYVQMNRSACALSDVEHASRT